MQPHVSAVVVTRCSFDLPVALPSAPHAASRGVSAGQGRQSGGGGQRCRARGPKHRRAGALSCVVSVSLSARSFPRLSALKPRRALLPCVAAACAPQTAQAQAQKALAEAARVTAERADEAAAAARVRAVREAKDRDDVLEHAARELGAAAAKTQALQARFRLKPWSTNLAASVSLSPPRARTRAEARPRAGAHQAASG